jgi:hypothetical protein
MGKMPPPLPFAGVTTIICFGLDCRLSAADELDIGWNSRVNDCSFVMPRVASFYFIGLCANPSELRDNIGF